jgi:hypothetical protein
MRSQASGSCARALKRVVSGQACHKAYARTSCAIVIRIFFFFFAEIFNIPEYIWIFTDFENELPGIPRIPGGVACLSGHGQVVGQAVVAFPLPPPASGSTIASSGRSLPVAFAVPSTFVGAQRAQLSSATFSQLKADSLAEEDGDEFEVLSSSSVEEQDESK